MNEIIELIRDITAREFGFIFNERMSRHISFGTQQDLEQYIRQKNPDHCFVSVAYYDDPQSMKGWRGADLFFDFDVAQGVSKRLAYAEAITVFEMLRRDFALKDLTLNFSGAKGYHVIAFDSAARTIDRWGRQQIVEYLQARGKLTTLDAPVSCDLHRLRRIAGTINAKSGQYCQVVTSAKQTEEARDNLPISSLSQKEGEVLA
jgi:predicted DNA primase small subunit